MKLIAKNWLNYIEADLEAATILLYRKVNFFC